MSVEYGYVYRVASADAEQLRALIEQHVGPGWAFSGAAQWDFDSRDGGSNLREIAPIPAVDLIDVKGDFGHAFSCKAEVRWKRRDDGKYDVLVLSEQQQMVNGAAHLYVPHWNSKTRIWEDGAWTIRRHGTTAIRQVGGRSPISYIDYLAPNGAVQFQRLLKVE